MGLNMEVPIVPMERISGRPKRHSNEGQIGLLM